MKLLDLFCGAGGAGEGYRRAGFEVTGVDIKPQPRNPHRFVQADALEYLATHGHEFDVIHASPPCQGYSKCKNMWGARQYPLLIGAVRSALIDSGRPYIIENVPGAPLQGVTLCGSMFGLGVARGYLRRHRIFETSFPLHQPQSCYHRGMAVGVYGHGAHGGKPRMLNKEEAAEALQIDWMTRDEMAQAIPPAYTERVGRCLLRSLVATA